MNDTLQTLMREATRLTQSGNLMEATAAIQRALGNTGAAPLPPSPIFSTPSPIILDDCVFEVAQPEAQPKAHPTQAPRPEAVQPEAVRPDANWPGRGEFTLGSHTHASLTRRYKLFTPPGSAGHSASKSLPLVVMLHGCTQNPDDFAAGTGMNQLAREQGFYVLYPEQAADANPQRCWNWFKHNHQSRGRGETALLASMTLAVIAQHGIDPRRVYIAGLSAGGAMAAIVAAAYPDVYAAVGVHSGLAVGAASNVSEALAAMRSGATGGKAGRVTGTVPTIVFHGDQDATVHSRNGEQVIAAAPDASGKRVEQGTSSGGRRFTRTVHQRSHAAKSNIHGDTSSDTSSDSSRDTFSDISCGTNAGQPASRTVAEHWLVHGGGHAWSGGDPKGSYTDPKGPDASREMLRFFSEQVLLPSSTK